MNLLSDSNNLIGKEAPEIISTESEGIHGSTELGLFISLATVLKRNLGLFLFSSINDEY